jgi:hypothetical protein
VNPLTRLMHRSVPTLVRLACVLALCALALFCISILFPRPLPVILAMSAGHAIGGAAFACYLLAVVVDATRRPSPPDSLPPQRIAEKNSAIESADAAGTVTASH